MNRIFFPAEILLPDFSRVDGTRWATVACDQYTSDPSYWETVSAFVGNAPSTLRLMLPEVYLKEGADRIPAIHAAMEQALAQTLVALPDAMIYLERTQDDGRIRRGIVGAVDLEAYDYNKGSTSPVRATEGTVLERIPPRVAVRRGAPLELPHVMLLIDDPEATVIEPLAARHDSPVYDFELMQKGGHVRGYRLSPAEQERVEASLQALVTPAAMEARYGSPSLAPLLFAVGDGNHSLASAKAYYEELKASLGDDEARKHPARYALCEVVNVHDPALDFEPIYRVVFGADPGDLIAAFSAHAAGMTGTAAPQSVTVLHAGRETVVPIPRPEKQLPVGTLQTFLDGYLAAHPGVTVDYIHGAEAVRDLVAADPSRVGFLFAGMEKSDLFRTVLYDGALPRKTFSMGHAHDKRFYLECRKIRK